MKIFKAMLVAALGLGVGACATGPSYYDGMVYQDGDYYAPAARGYGDYYLGQEVPYGGYYGDPFFAPYGYGAPYGWSGFGGYCSVRYRYCPSIGFVDPWSRFDLWIHSGWGWYDPRWNDGWYSGYYGPGYGGGHYGGGWYGGGWYGGGHWSDGRRHRRPRPPSSAPAPAPAPSVADGREGPRAGAILYVPPPNAGEWETYYDGTTPMPRPGQPAPGAAVGRDGEPRLSDRPMPRRIERPRSEWRAERPAASGGGEARGGGGGRSERPARAERSERSGSDEAPRARRREQDER
jgi:hypothetical protein